MRHDWEIKESILKSIAWVKPETPIPFIYDRFRETVQALTTLEQVQNCKCTKIQSSDFNY